MKVIIAGSRDFNDYKLLEKSCRDILKNKVDEIISGCAKGADKLGEVFANSEGIKITPFPANWGKYGKRAGFIRNKEMALYGDLLIAFWDGKSKGTKNMIELAKKYKLKVHVIYYLHFTQDTINKKSLF